MGLDWFEYFFQNDFVMIMRNTLATSLLTLLFSFPAPILIAIFLNEVRSMRMKKFVQTASYLPILFPGLLRRTFSSPSFPETVW